MNDKDKAILLNRKMVGVIAVQNIALVDKPFGVSLSSIKDYLMRCSYPVKGAQMRGEAIRFVPATAALIDIVGPDLEIGDLVAIVRADVDVSGAVGFVRSVLGLDVTIRYINNTVSQTFSTIINCARLLGTAGVPLSADNDSATRRDIQTTPQGGGNSPSKFGILPVTSPAILSPDTTAENGYSALTEQSESDLSPIPLALRASAELLANGAYDAMTIILKGQADVAQQADVIPFFDGNKPSEDLFTYVMAVAERAGKGNR